MIIQLTKNQAAGATTLTVLVNTDDIVLADELEQINMPQPKYTRLTLRSGAEIAVTESAADINELMAGG